MRKARVTAIENNPDVQQTFRDVIQSVASAQLVALAAIAAPNTENPAQAVMAQRLDRILTTMLAMQGIDFTGGSLPGSTPDQARTALLSFIRACMALRDPATDAALWPYGSVDDVCDAIEDGSFQAVVRALVATYYQVIAAPLQAAQPQAVLGWR